jgi:hypothetical protein
MSSKKTKIEEETKEETKEEKFTPKSPFSYKITPNFTYGEFCNKEEVRRFTKQH